MARYRNKPDEQREYYRRTRREPPWEYDDPYAGRGRSLGEDSDHPDYSRGRFGERAEDHTAKPNDRVVDVIRKMGDKQVRRIPVVGEKGNLRGIISMGDVAVETEEDRELAEAVEEISKSSSFWGRIFG